MINTDLLINNIDTNGFHIIDGFLDFTDYQSLYDIAQELYQKGLFTNAKIGLKKQAQQNKTIRSDEIHWLNEQSEVPAIQTYFKQIQKITHSLNQSFFLGLIEFETHFAVYQPGAFYQKHCDQFAITKDRKISCVYYLNKNWQQEFGGELKLYNHDDQFIETIYPMENRFVCFNSELPHEVCVTNQPRYSIAGWLKSRQMTLTA